MSETQETNPVQDLIKYSIDQDYTQASKTFGDIMTIKMNDILDQEKIRLSDQIYNGVEDGSEEGGEQLDLDDGDEEVSDESSEDQSDDEEDAGIDDETDDELEETEEDEE